MTATLFDQLDTKADLERLIASGEREGHTLEYKDASKPIKQRDEVAKDISAFANASGGLIVYGIATDPADKTKPVACIPIDVRNIECIEQANGLQIRPLVPDIRMKPILDDSVTIAFAVDVPPSDHAPHQVTSSCVYYRREQAHNVRMTHDIVELYFGRRLGPQLELTPRLKPIADVCKPDYANRQYEFDVQVNNVGRRAARYATVQAHFLNAAHHRVVGINDRRAAIMPDPVTGGTIVLWENNAGLVYQATIITVCKVAVAVGEHYNGPRIPLFYVSAFADDMKQRHVAGWLERSSPDAVPTLKTSSLDEWERTVGVKLIDDNRPS